MIKLRFFKSICRSQNSEVKLFERALSRKGRLGNAKWNLHLSEEKKAKDIWQVVDREEISERGMILKGFCKEIWIIHKRSKSYSHSFFFKKESKRFGQIRSGYIFVWSLVPKRVVLRLVRLHFSSIRHKAPSWIEVSFIWAVLKIFETLSLRILSNLLGSSSWFVTFMRISNYFLEEMFETWNSLN